MRKSTVSFCTMPVLVIIIMLLPGCLKDTVTKTYKIYSPVYQTSAELRDNIKSNASQKISNPGKIFLRDKYIFLSEINKGVHIIDNSNPAAPKNMAFINIPGNMDLAVKGNILYADLYSYLVAIDITDPLKASAKILINNAFPERRNANGFSADSNKIITEWVSRDTTVNEDQLKNKAIQSCTTCSMGSPLSSMFPGPASTTGTGGSMARFSIIKNSLYTVTTSNLNVYSIASPENPVVVNKLAMGWGIETIFPFKDKLFIGSSDGVYIYDVADENNPLKIGQFNHVTSCDPVITDGKYAFATLSSGARCRNASNVLDVLDVSSLSNPSLIKSYPMINPHGLSKDGNNLFVCDGTDGLKMYNATDVNKLTLINHIKGFDTYDVIATNNLAIVVAKDGLRQYNYSNINDLRLLSKLGWAE